MLIDIQRDPAVFFKVQDQTRKNYYLCVCSDGILGLESRQGDKMMFFHHFALIQNFTAPPKDSLALKNDPAGYVLYHNETTHTLLFKFEKSSERHLFLNICTRFAAQYVETEKERKMKKQFRDRASSQGLESDSKAAVVAAIRNRRGKERATIGYENRQRRRTLRFEKEEVMIEEAHARMRSYTK